MSDLIFLNPIFHEKIWGGTRLKTIFNYEIPSEKTGECWAISGHQNGDCEIMNGPFQGKTLSYLWKNHRELFGNVKHNCFPLLTKILDASDHLSVQVHPDDKYGLKHAGELGKTECWYILDADADTELIFGHHAKTKEEFINLIESNNWNQLLRKIKIKKGDFFYVPAGTIHGLKKGTLVLEIQQSSDTTYRLYDYNRPGNDGLPRPLHLNQSIEVSTIPHKQPSSTYSIENFANCTITTFINCNHFKVSKWEINGTYTTSHDQPFTLFSVLDGKGLINGYSISKGQHFIVLSTVRKIKIQGHLQLILATI